MMLVFAVAVMAQDKPAEKAEKKDVGHKFIGSQKCKACHNSPAKGEQFKKWTESKHAKAFETLATPEAKEVGTKAGVDNPQTSEQCLACHVTGAAAPASAKDVSFNQTEGVGCEACHGAGSDYKDMKIMKDQAAAVAAGMVIPTEKTCAGCHNEKSPTFKGFEYAKMWAQIAHPIPEKKAE
jgi:nitrate/TMAO reductase-like tetraheme cytochrome c subunit